MGQYIKDSLTHTAEVAFTVRIREDYHGQGVATEILKYLVLLAKNDELHGFTAEVLFENRPMVRVFEKMEFDIQRTIDGNSYSIFLDFEGKRKMTGESSPDIIESYKKTGQARKKDGARRGHPPKRRTGKLAWLLNLQK